jgi:7-keto-8-aminopelargonate synthetase-like enzyme
VSSATAIVPIPVGLDHDTMAVSRRLYERGFFIPGIRPPTVPEGKGRLRLTFMATHTPDMLKEAALQIDESLKELSIEPY